jgi:eukaryotic-like serine/threonine-protein kinase
VGTPQYMSPEQIRTGIVDHRSDLWSLAVLTYRALTGSPPFHSDHLGALLVSICAEPFLPVSSIVAEMPAHVDVFFNKALAKDPDKRFASAGEFGTAFASLVNSVAGSAKILVTDDEPDVSTIVQKRFRKQIQEKKYQFVFATDGENALQVMREHPDIEVVLTDINMPRMDGLTFLSHMNEVNPLARAVVVSAYSELSNIRTAMNRGAFDFLVKPIDFKDLATTIDKTLKHVAEVRKGLLANEENAFLRMSVTPRMLEHKQASAVPLPPETWPGSIAVIGIGSEEDEIADTDRKEYIRVLNSNLEVIIPAILRRRGVIDRFVGRSIIAIFRGDNHLHSVLDTCHEIRNQLLKLARRTGNHSPFAAGIHVAIMTGQVMAAEIGSRAFERIENTLFGDTLKTAKRLHQTAHKNQILVSAAIAETTGDTFDYVLVDPADPNARGPIYELRGRKEGQAAADIKSPDEDTKVDPSGIRFVRDEPPTRAGGSST